MYISLYISTGGHDPPPCHTYIYIDNYTDQSLILLTTISCLLGAIQWITKMPINVFRQSRCLNTSDSICDLFKWVCDRNDRNDKGNGKSYVRANDRGLQISCHSCHLCHWGGLRANSCHLTYYLILTMPMHFVTIKAASHNSGAILMITHPQGGPMAIGLCI